MSCASSDEMSFWNRSVSVTNDAPEPQVHDQRRQKGTCEEGVGLDHAQIRSDAAQVVGVDPDAPLICEARELRVAKVDHQDLVDQHFGERGVAGPHDVPADLLDQVVDRLSIRKVSPPEQGEDLADDPGSGRGVSGRE